MSENKLVSRRAILLEIKLFEKGECRQWIDCDICCRYLSKTAPANLHFLMLSCVFNIASDLNCVSLKYCVFLVSLQLLQAKTKKLLKIYLTVQGATKHLSFIEMVDGLELIGSKSHKRGETEYHVPY